MQRITGLRVLFQIHQISFAKVDAQRPLCFRFLPPSVANNEQPGRLNFYSAVNASATLDVTCIAKGKRKLERFREWPSGWSGEGHRNGSRALVSRLKGPPNVASFYFLKFHSTLDRPGSLQHDPTWTIRSSPPFFRNRHRRLLISCFLAHEEEPVTFHAHYRSTESNLKFKSGRHGRFFKPRVRWRRTDDPPSEIPRAAPGSLENRRMEYRGAE